MLKVDWLVGCLQSCVLYTLWQLVWEIYEMEFVQEPKMGFKKIFVKHSLHA